MINIDKENKIITVSDPLGIEFEAGGYTVPMTNGEGFIANLPDDFFARDFTVRVICGKESYIAPVPEIVEEIIPESEPAE